MWIEVHPSVHPTNHHKICLHVGGRHAWASSVETRRDRYMDTHPWRRTSWRTNDSTVVVCHA